MSTPEQGWLEDHQEMIKDSGPRLVAELAKSGFAYPVGFISDPRCRIGCEVMFVTSLARGNSEEEAAKGIELLIAQATLMGGACPSRWSTLEYENTKELLEACGLMCPEWEAPNSYLIFIFAANVASYQFVPRAESEAWAKGHPSSATVKVVNVQPTRLTPGNRPSPFVVKDCVSELAQGLSILRAHEAGEITLDAAAQAIGRLHNVARRDTTFDGKLCLDDYYVAFYGHFVNMHGKVQPKALVVINTLEKAESWWKLHGDGEPPCPPHKIARTLLLELAELCMKHGMDVMVEGKSVCCKCGSQLGAMEVMCVHLKDGDDWWGIPSENGHYHWACSSCVKKVQVGGVPDIDDIRLVCSKCVRLIQGKNSRLLYPIAKGENSLLYDDKPPVSPGNSGTNAEARKRRDRRRKLKERRRKQKAKNEVKCIVNSDPWQEERIAKELAEKEKVYFWLAVNGASVVACPLPVSKNKIRCMPTPEQLIGFPTQQEQLENQKFLQTADISAVKCRMDEWVPRIDTGEMACIKPATPDPTTAGPTRWPC